jgi:uncharacterized membrane protein
MSSQKAPSDHASTSLFSPERWSFTMALAAGLCWSGALLLLFLANLSAEADPLAPQRLLFYMLVLTAGVLTFVPIQHGLGLSSLAFEGIGGTALLFYTIAFVPPPTGWLLSLPDLPVYMLLILSLFWTSSAVVQPFVYAAGQRLFKHRARRRDVRRARRQSYEIGLLVACLAILAALRVLSWVSLLLLVLILVIGELLLLSRIEVQRR